MSIRLLLAAVVTLALLAGSIPAIEAANEARAERALAGTMDELAWTIRSVPRENDPVPSGVPGARRRVDVDMPEGTTAQLSLDPDGVPRSESNATATISYRITGGRRHQTPVDVRLAVVGPGGWRASERPLVLRDDAVLTLSYRLVDGRPAVTVTRGFIPGDRTNPAHVESAG